MKIKFYEKCLFIFCPSSLPLNFFYLIYFWTIYIYIYIHLVCLTSLYFMILHLYISCFEKINIIWKTREDIPPSTLISDLRNLLINAGETGGLGDVIFKVEGTQVVAHKALCMRCAFFRTLLTGQRERERNPPSPHHPTSLLLIMCYVFENLCVEKEAAYMYIFSVCHQIFCVLYPLYVYAK